MRLEGASLGEIAAATGCAKSTISLWVRDVPLREEQLVALADRNRDRARKVGHLAWSRQNRDRRTAAQADGRRRAQDREPLHLAGCMLYRAEGAKNRNTVTFTNSDVDMMVFFLEFLRRCLRGRG